MIDETQIRAELAKVVKNDNHDGQGFFRYRNYRTEATDELIRRGWARGWMRIQGGFCLTTDLVESTARGRCIAVLHGAWERAMA